MDEAEVSEEAVDEGQAKEAMDEGAMDEESDGGVDSDEARAMCCGCPAATASLIASPAIYTHAARMTVPTLTRSVGEAMLMPNAPVVRPAAILVISGGSPLKSLPV